MANPTCWASLGTASLAAIPTLLPASASDTLLLLSFIKRSTLSALEYEQMPGGPQVHRPPPQYVMKYNLFIM